MQVPRLKVAPRSKEQLGESAGHTAVLRQLLGDAHWELWVFQQFSRLAGGAHLTAHPGSAETPPQGAEVLQTSMAPGCTKPLALSTGSS